MTARWGESSGTGSHLAVKDYAFGSVTEAMESGSSLGHRVRAKPWLTAGALAAAAWVPPRCDRLEDWIPAPPAPRPETGTQQGRLTTLPGDGRRRIA